MILLFGPWRPDLPDADSTVTDAINVVPIVQGYAPQPALVAQTPTLPNRVLGAVSLVDAAGNAYWFAGTVRNLWMLNVTTTTWCNVSRLIAPWVTPIGYGAGVGIGSVPAITPIGHASGAGFGVPNSSSLGVAVGADFGLAPLLIPGGFVPAASHGLPQVQLSPPSYSTASTESWVFAQYGEQVFATNYTDPIQVYTLGSGTRFNDLDGGPPQARFLAVVKNFLVAANTYDTTDGAVTQRVRWSAIDNPHSWTVDSTSLADFQDLLGDGGANQGIVAGLTQADAVVLQERAVWKMTYVGTPNIFEFDQLEGIRGTPAPSSIVAAGGKVYYYGEDGFYSFDGAISVPIGAGKIDSTFRNDIDVNNVNLINGVYDSQRRLILWAWPDGSDPDNLLTDILIYALSTGEWSTARVTTELLWQTISFSYTLEDLDAFGTLETINASFDSRQWTGGLLQLSAFDSAHRVAHFNGPDLPATIVTSELTMPDPKRVLVTATWPIIDGATSAAISVGRRKRMADSVSWAASTTVGPLGFCPQRISDHYLRFRLSLSSVWTKAIGIDVTVATPTTWR